MSTSKHNLPYLLAYGRIGAALEKIKTAATPDRFSGDFLSTKLGMSGGSARPIIPFLKRIGFLGSDGAPTELYKQFRNPKSAGNAAAQALRVGYAALFEINEQANELSDTDLRGVVVQATGLEAKSTAVKSIIGSFKALKAFASSKPSVTSDELPDPRNGVAQDGESADVAAQAPRLGLSYTINLNLPATSDPAVFNAIFRSLRDNLLN